MEEKILLKGIVSGIAKKLKLFGIICMCIPTVLTWPIGIILLVLYFYMSKMEITITNKRVYGCSAFGKRVDLPNDSISAVGTSYFRGIDVATSAGTIKFKNMENNIELHKLISDIIVKRQSTTQNKNCEFSDDLASNLSKFKKLLDDGVITQEEFDAKKKQLLGL